MFFSSICSNFITRLYASLPNDPGEDSEKETIIGPDRYSENCDSLRFGVSVDYSTAGLRSPCYGYHYVFYYLANFTIALTFSLLQCRFRRRFAAARIPAIAFMFCAPSIDTRIHIRINENNIFVCARGTPRKKILVPSQHYHLINMQVSITMIFYLLSKSKEVGN